jgi:ribosome hibernation promoting factor
MGGGSHPSNPPADPRTAVRVTTSRPLGEVSVRTIVKGKNIEVPERTRSYTERKLKRLDRFLDDRSDALVELSVEQHRSASDSHIVEVTLVIDGRPIRGHAAAVSHQAGVDEVVDKLERRAVDYLDKPRLRARPEQEKQILRKIADGTATNEREPQIVKTKRFAIEPMFEEDAATQMDELGHQFFVFVNAETERVCILYRRDDGDLGLIEPIIGGEYTKGRSKARSNGSH